MTAASQYVTRRATMEDLSQLMALWQLEQLAADALEKRFTEFQIVSDESGRVLAAIGIQISGAHGLLHSESIAQPELGDTLRELLWKRLQVIIHNHALEKLWMQTNVPFWRGKSFEPASAEQMTSMPPQFKENERPWQIKILRTPDANAAIEREFARLQSVGQEESARMQLRVQWMKRAALGVTVVVFILVIIWAIAMLKYGPQILHKR